MSAIVVARAMRGGVDVREMVRAAAEVLLGEAPGRWEVGIESPAVAGGMVWRGPKPVAGAGMVRGEDVTVLMDGFLSAGPAGKSKSADESDAALVGALYRNGDTGALERLEGSFVVAIADHRRGRLIVVTDRSGSRPVYVGRSRDAVVIAPEPKAFCGIDGMTGEILPGSILSMAVNAYLFGELSYWRGVELLGPARMLIVESDRVEKRRYWAPVFDASRPPSAQELEGAVGDCVERHIRGFDRPVLALSGGVDSRVMLAAARQAGLKLDTVTWTYDTSESGEADFAVARRVAEAAGVPHAEHRLSDRKLASQAERIVYASDGLSGFLGAFGDRERLAEELASRHDAILFGDQCYRGEREIQTTADALERVGIRVGPRVSLVRFLMRREAAEACLADYQAKIDALLSEIGDVGAAHNLHDRLYWQVRVPRLLTGPKALWRLYLESLSPLLDVPMLELAGRLPVEQRAEKTFLRESLGAMAPELSAVGFSAVHSRTKWRRIFKEAGELQRYIVETLLDPLPAFDAWFDRASIEMWLKSCMVEARGASAADVSPGGVLTRLGRRVRSVWVNRAFNPRVVLNLLTLKLWCYHFDHSSSR